MLIARWQIDARFGHKQTVVDLLRKWEREVGTKAGTDKMDFKILTGSIGAREATVEANHTVESIAQLEQFFAAIGKIEAHRERWDITDLRHALGVDKSDERVRRIERQALDRELEQAGLRRHQLEVDRSPGVER